MDISDVTGSFGPWQRRVFIVLFYINIVSFWQNLSITFFAPNMPFNCTEPKGVANISYVAPDFDDRCHVTVEQPLGNTSVPMVVPCTKWEYDKSQFSETIVSEWDLVCDREWLVSLAKSIYMVGFFVSVIIFGQLSDSVGRFPTIVIGYIIITISMLLTLCSTSYAMFITLRFCEAVGRSGLTTVAFVLMTEIVGSQHRTEVGITIQLGWSTGFVTLAGVAYLFRDWFSFQLAMSLPVLPIVFTFWIIPESPRWLVMMGKVQKLEKILNKAVAMNGRELKMGFKDIEQLKNKAKEAENTKSKTLLDLFRAPIMTKRAFNMLFQWSVSTFMYYGLSYNTNDLAGDPYLNFFVAGALEFPSFFLLLWTMKRFGRRLTLVGNMMVGGAACAAIIPVPESLGWLQTGLSMVGKFCVTGTQGLLYLYTSELFPTVIRNVVLGMCSMCGRIGSAIAPFAKEMGQATHPSVPYIIYASLTISSGLLALLLPETRGQKMPDTLEEGETFGQIKVEETLSSELDAKLTQNAVICEKMSVNLINPHDQRHG